MALVQTSSVMTLGRRGRDHATDFSEHTATKRRKQSTPETAFSDSEDDYRSSFEDENSSEVSIPPTPRSKVSTATNKSARPLKYKCPLEGCDKAFSRPVRLEEHIRAHNNERHFKCEYDSCGKTFLRQSHLNDHVKSAHTGERDYACDWPGCDKKFTTGTRLKRHREAHEKKNTFRCTGFPPCDQTFRKHATLQRHINTEHLELKAYPCQHHDEVTGSKCDAAFDTAHRLRTHEARCHESKQYLCAICQTAHDQNTENPEDPFAFATYAELQTHMKLQHPPECEHCGWICSTAGELQRHIDLHHSGTSLDDRRTFICPFSDCGKGFTKQGNLNIHVRSTHEKKKPFVCGETDLTQSSGLQSWDGSNACLRGFTAKASLETHVRKFHIDGVRPNRPTKNTKRGPATDQGTYRQTLSASAKLTGAGYATESGRALSCPVTSCQHRFKRHGDLRQHTRTMHGIGDLETIEALVEQEALNGGRFWLGGVNDDDDWREITGLDTPAVNVSAGGGPGFSLPSAGPGFDEAGADFEQEENRLAGLLASCLREEVVDPALLEKS